MIFEFCIASSVSPVLPAWLLRHRLLPAVRSSVERQSMTSDFLLFSAQMRPASTMSTAVEFEAPFQISDSEQRSRYCHKFKNVDRKRIRPTILCDSKSKYRKKSVIIKSSPLGRQKTVSTRVLQVPRSSI